MRARLGIVGGIAPTTTASYYATINALYFNRFGRHPRIVIDSIDQNEMLALFANENVPELVEFFGDALDRLRRVGADFALIASTAPHVHFEAIAARSSLPLLSLVEAAVGLASNTGVARWAVIGPSVGGDAYAPVLRQHGLSVSFPDTRETAEIQRLYLRRYDASNVSEADPGVFYRQVARRLIRDESAAGLFLAGAKLPPHFHDFEVPVIDTAKAHIEAAVERLGILEEAASRDERQGSDRLQLRGEATTMDSGKI